MNGLDELAVRAEGLLNHFWLMQMSDEDTRKKMGLKYISHMWDSCPYWYIWFQDMPGVFKLELVECNDAEGWDWEAFFRVKYYPAVDETAFQGLSVLEQLCRTGGLFNNLPAEWPEGSEGCACHGGAVHHAGKFEDLAGGTGVPDVRRSAEIPGDFFLAGQLRMAQRGEQESRISWESQNRWRVTMVEDYYVPDLEGSPMKLLRSGDVDRDFPGWMITDFIGRRLVSGWKEQFGYKIFRENYEEEAGLDYICDGENLTAQRSGEVKKKEVCVILRH